MKKTCKRIFSLGLAAALSLSAWILPASAAAVGTNLERLIEIRMKSKSRLWTFLPRSCRKNSYTDRSVRIKR